MLGLALTYVAVRTAAEIGTSGAPFLGSYRLRIGPASLLAPAIASAVLAAAAFGWLDRLPWPVVPIAGFGAAFAWALALALVDGTAGLSRSLLSEDEYATDIADVGTDPLGYLRRFTSATSVHSSATRGHPPGPVLLLWGLRHIGMTSPLATGVLITALGALTVALVLAAVRGVCGETPARRYAPALALAPYAVWSAVSLDAVVALLGAALVLAGVRASAAERPGLRRGAWSLLAGLLVGVAALFSYAAPWLGLSVVLLYFARRRPFLNVATGFGALVPLLAVQLLGFRWVDGLMSAHDDHLSRIDPNRSALWWGVLSVVVLLLATGPASVAGAARVRNTPGWPFLVGAAVAVTFTIVAGFARGGAEHAWLPFFPWLTVAAVAPLRQAGPPVPTPLLLAGVGAAAAIVIEAVLVSPW
jgi:methylthioxylose transferase